MTMTLKDDVNLKKDPKTYQTGQFFDALNAESVSGAIMARANADATSGFETQAPSGGESNMTLLDKVTMVQIKQGDTKGESTIVMTAVEAGNYYGISPDTFGAQSRQEFHKTLERRRDLFEQVEKIIDTQANKTSALLSNIQDQASITASISQGISAENPVQYTKQLNEDLKKEYKDKLATNVKYVEGDQDATRQLLAKQAADKFDKMSADLLVNIQTEITKSNKVLGGGLQKVANGLLGYGKAFTMAGNGQLSAKDLQSKLNDALQTAGSGIGEMVGGAIFGDNPGLMGKITTKILSFVGKWALGNQSLFELASEAISEWWSHLDVITTVVSTIGKLAGLPPKVTDSVTKFAKKLWTRGIEPSKIFEMFDKMKVDGKKINEPSSSISFDFDISNIGAMIKAVFSAGTAPLKFVDDLLAPVQSVLESPILYIALMAWMILKPNTGAYTTFKIALSIKRAVVWARAKLASLITDIDNIGNKIVDFVDGLIREALQWLLNAANVGMQYLQPVLSMVPFDSTIILKGILSMFTLNHTIEITEIAGVTASDKAECGIGNQKVNQKLQKSNQEVTSNTQSDMPGSKGTAPKSEQCESKASNATDSEGKPRQLQLDTLPECLLLFNVG